jgi:hypothetical protein
MKPSLLPGDLLAASVQQLTVPTQKKITKYRHLTNVAFNPIIISLGGMIEDSAMKQFDGWKEAVGGVASSFVLRRMSVCLLRCRVKVWRFE